MSNSENVRLRQVGKNKEKDSKVSRLTDLTEEEATLKASRGWIRHFVGAFLLTPILCVLILSVIPSNIEPVKNIEMPPPIAFTGPLEPNDVLLNAERLLPDQLNGPESIAIDGDHIYTGTADGWVNHIHNGQVRRLLRFGKGPCGGLVNENTCGRPLGMRLDKNGLLIVCDAYFGLFQVNVVTGDYVPLYLASTPVNGKSSKLLNDLDIASDGKIYFTDSSTEWHRNQFHYILMEGRPTGRLLMYDPATGETTQLMGDLLFANGVQLTPDQSSVLVVECAKARIFRFDLKTKQVSLWTDKLPGFPDNIRYHKSTATYWVGIAKTRQAGQFSLIDALYSLPWLRGLIAKVADLEILLRTMKITDMSKVKAIAVELNSSGHILRSLQDQKGAVIESVSEVEGTEHTLYLGSYNANYLGRIYKKNISK